jgi:hypothetical protein
MFQTVANNGEVKLTSQIPKPVSELEEMMFALLSHASISSVRVMYEDLSNTTWTRVLEDGDRITQGE